MEEIHHLLGKEFFLPGKLPLRILRRTPQPEYPMHTHDFMEMVIVTDGSGIHLASGAETYIHKGDIFVIKGDVTHGYHKLNDLCLVNILFDLTLLAIPLADIGRSAGFHTFFRVEPHTRALSVKAPRFSPDAESFTQLLGQVSSIEKDLGSSQPGSQFKAIAGFMTLIATLSQQFDAFNKEIPDHIPYRIGQALSFVESNLTRNIHIQELIDIAHMSESSLLRTFKVITGKSPMQYHLFKRISLAKEFLDQPEYKITEVANLIGFSDSNYFSRVFKSVEGMSPKQYRESLNQL